MNPIQESRSSLLQYLDLTPSLDELDRYRNLFDHAPYGYLLLDAEDRIQMVNLTLAQMLTLQRSDLLARPVIDFVDPKDRANFYAHVNAVRQQGIPQRIYLSLGSGSKWFPVLAESRLENGSASSVQIALIDFTQEYNFAVEKIESEARYRLFFENANDFVLVHGFMDNMGGRFFEVNEAVCARLGYTREEMLQLTPSDVVHPDNRHRIPQERSDLIAKGTIFFEQTLVTKSDEEIPVEVHAHLFEWQGKPTVLSIVRDITQRRLAQRQAQRLKEDYETIFNSAQDALFLIKVEGPGQFRYLRTNTYHQQKTGILLEQIQHKTPEELTGDEAGKRLAQNYQRCVDAGTPITYEEELTLSGITRTWLTTLTPVAENGQVTQIVGSATDITERIQAERALRESETRFRDLFEYSSVAYQSLDVNGRFIDANPQLCAMLGYSRDELIGRSFGDVWHPDMQPFFQERFNHFIFNGATPAELKLTHKNGEAVSVVLNGRVQQDGAGNFMRTHCVLYNITERKRSEAQTLALALEQERVHLLTQFIQNTSHEFLTPLAVISSDAHLLLRVDNAEKRNRYYDRIKEQIGLLTRLVDMLMEIVKLESRAAMNIAQIHTTIFLKSLCELFEVRVDTHKLSYQIADDLPPILGDQSYLQRAISHILENAYRFTPAGDEICFNATLTNKGVEITIQDSGPGIDAEILPHIFDTLWRQDQAHTTPGLGLGLSMTQKIIQLHGGHIEVESEPGQGAIFRVILPPEKQ
jgi:PAS domain S-box-containing protein